MHNVTVDEINGRWFARVPGDHILAGPFDSHSAAWRWVDRQEGSPISRSEHVAEWIWNKIANGGPCRENATPASGRSKVLPQVHLRWPATIWSAASGRRLDTWGQMSVAAKSRPDVPPPDMGVRGAFEKVVWSAFQRWPSFLVQLLRAHQVMGPTIPSFFNCLWLPLGGGGSV
jgi:hypothetical protein